METEAVFLPARRSGIFLQFALVLVLVAAAAVGISQASQETNALAFFLHLLPLGLALVFVPWLLYNILSIRRASYSIERDGIRLVWGLRVVDIPIGEVIWAGSTEAYPSPVLPPRMHWPGAVLGRRSLPGGKTIEFMASQTSSLFLIDTASAAYVISPEDPDKFLQSYHDLVELGSLSPFPARSVFPSFLLARFWRDRLARSLLIFSILLSLVLLFSVTWTLPLKPGSVPVLLLPVLNTSFFIINLILALFFFRRAGDTGQNQDVSRALSYLVLGWGAFTPVLFLLGAYFQLFRP
jgi:hypothetical protein